MSFIENKKLFRANRSTFLNNKFHDDDEVIGVPRGPLPPNF